MAKRKKDNEDQSDENLNNADDAADNFGLPDIEYKPLDRDENTRQEIVPEEEVEHEEPETYIVEEKVIEEKPDEYVYPDEEERSKAPLVISLIIALVVGVAGFLLYKYVYVPKVEKDKQEKLAKEADDKHKADEARLAREKEEEDRKRSEAEAVAKAKPVAGTIETLSQRTRRYYVIVSSDIDDDLIMDYAKKLSAKGISCKVIPPYGTYKYYRLAISDFDSYGAAQSGADASKAEYGNGLWVMRY